MKKIRIGNDFVFAWEIERNGLPEDLSSVLEKHLHLSVFGKRVELIEGVDYDITGNVIRIEVTPTIANILGTYKAEFHYILPDNGLIDDDRKCAVDVDAFQIVAKTAQADDSTEFSMTSDMAIAFKGDKGDSAYQVWLDAGNIGTEEDYFVYLQKPATDAGASISELEGEIQENEGLRVSAESERDLAEAGRIQSESERLASEIIRQSNEGDRIENEATRVQNEAERISKENVRQSNEIDRVEAESERVQAENERAQAEVERQATIQEAVTATNLANEKANLANVAAQSANEAAGLADTARTELTTAVNAKLGEADDKIEEMDTTLSTYDGRVTQVESDITQLAGDVNFLKLNNVVVNGDFSNGTTEWSWGSNITSVSADNEELTFMGGGSPSIAGTNQVWQISGTGSEQTHITYITCLAKTNGENDAGFRFGEGYNLSNPYPLTKTLMPYSFLRQSKVIGVRRVTFGANLGASVTVKNIIFLNLTLLFGEGYEPTKSEMDLLISILGVDYFEGEVTIPAQKVMQWQLKMIRQNRSAIIALGGTIV